MISNKDTMCEKRIIVVLGMHRSGTSAITRCLSVMGVELGNNLMQPILGNNDKGFWEDIDISQLNDEILSELGLKWHSLISVTEDDLNTIIEKGYLEKAQNILKDKLQHSSIIGFKDPRVSKLLIFWDKVFELLNVNINYVFSLRNPISVAESLNKRDGLEKTKSYYLWIDHILSSLSYSQNRKLSYIDYDKLIESTDVEVERLSKELNLDINKDEFLKYKDEFLVDNLRHSKFDLDDLKSDECCPSLLMEIYSELSNDVVSISSKKITSWNKKHKDFCEILNLTDTYYEKIEYNHKQIVGISAELNYQCEQNQGLNEQVKILDEKGIHIKNELQKSLDVLTKIKVKMRSSEKEVEILTNRLADVENTKTWKMMNALKRIKNWCK